MSVTVPMSCETASELATDSYWPELDYIRRRISIRHVARELGLEVFGNSARCWRGEQHQNGDRSPSMGFTKRNRARCYVCDSRSMGVLDLVMGVRGCDLPAAVEWITARWNVPRVKSGKHVNRREPSYPNLRVLVRGSPFEYWVRTGFWAHLSNPARSVLVALFGLADVDTSTAQASFRALRRYAGVSFGSVAKGIRELERAGLLQVDRAFNRAAAPERTLNAYKLCPAAPEFLEHVFLVQKTHSAEIQFEKNRQKQRRQLLKAHYSLQTRNPNTSTQGTSLSTRKSTSQIHALTIRARDCVGRQKQTKNDAKLELEKLRLEAEILGRKERARQAEELRRELNAGRGPEAMKRG